MKPTAIVGESGVPHLFTRPVVEAMAKINERPLIFPYSNPTSRSECTAEEAYRWSGGRAIFASGSPFAPVDIDGHAFVPGQGNNVYVFPAVGLAVFATEASRVTDEMFIIAARAVAEQVSAESLAMGLIYPPQSRIIEASLHVAARVAEHIYDAGLAPHASASGCGRLRSLAHLPPGLLSGGAVKSKDFPALRPGRRIRCHWRVARGMVGRHERPTTSESVRL